MRRRLARVLRSPLRGAARALAPLALVAAVSACELPGYDAPEGATSQGQKIFGLWQGSVTAALAVGGVVCALILFVVVWYGRRRGDDSEPSQRQYNLPLEIFYTIVPLLIVAGLFYFTIKAQTTATKISANPAVQVEVTAFQWGWRFDYTGTGVVVASPGGPQRPTLMLPEDQTTRITLISVDVIHSFYVPDFLYKRDAIPGMVNTFDFTPVRTGQFLGRCAEFCGLQHPEMLFDVEVVSPQAFQTWLAEQQPVPGLAEQEGTGR